MCAMKTRISLLSITAAVVTMSPAIATADPIDDALAKLPAGEITCEQAESYWTTESEYEAIRAQAQIVATFHDRGDEIIAALARVDEVADRCGLKDEAESEGRPATPATPAAPAAPAAPENTFEELIPKALDYLMENRDEILAYLPELSSGK